MEKIHLQETAQEQTSDVEVGHPDIPVYLLTLQEKPGYSVNAPMTALQLELQEAKASTKFTSRAWT